MSFDLDLLEISDHPTEDFNCGDEVDISISIVVIFMERLSTASQPRHLLARLAHDRHADLSGGYTEVANIISGNILTVLLASNMKCDI